MNGLYPVSASVHKASLAITANDYLPQSNECEKSAQYLFWVDRLTTAENSTSTRTFRTHLLSSDTGESHTLAAITGLDFCPMLPDDFEPDEDDDRDRQSILDKIFRNTQCHIQIHGTYVAVAFSWKVEYPTLVLSIWDWKSGRKVTVSRRAS